MKKRLCIALVLVTMLTLVASVAFAGVEKNTFDYSTIYCQANREVGLNSYVSNKKLAAYAGKLYVRHYLHGEFGGVYTNYFKAGAAIRNAPTLYGGNWMAPDTANYVRSASLVADKPWYAYGRANTDYGLNTIVISGYSHINA